MNNLPNPLAVLELQKLPINQRFRGFLPIVIDIETSGVEPRKNAILEIAALSLDLIDGKLVVANTWHAHLEPFKGAIIDPASLEFTKIVIDHPFRMAKSEIDGLTELAKFIKGEVKRNKCKRGILVGHNSWFDLHFLNAGFHRHDIKSPMHKFSSIDTATLGALLCGQTVLASALKALKIPFDPVEAHSALYDAQKTAELFCSMVNSYHDLIRPACGGPPSPEEKGEQ